MTLKIVTTCLMLLVFTGTFVPAQEKLVFSTLPALNPIVRICEPIIQAAYKKMGIDAIVHHYPPARAIQLANEGHTDGELFRSIHMDGQFPNLVMVPVAITHADVMAFTTDLRFLVQGWESVRPYRIGIQRGFKLVEARTAGMNTYAANNVKHVFQMLAAGRVDVVITTRLSGLSTVKSLQLEGIHMLTPPLDQETLHHFLHKKYQRLVPQLAATLDVMCETGEIEAIITRVEQEMLP